MGKKPVYICNVVNQRSGKERMETRYIKPPTKHDHEVGNFVEIIHTENREWLSVS